MPLASWQYPCSPSSTSTCSLCCISRCCTSCKSHIKQIIWPTYIRKRSAQLMKLQRFKLISSLNGFTGCWWSSGSFAGIASCVKITSEVTAVVFPHLTTHQCFGMYFWALFSVFHSIFKKVFLFKCYLSNLSAKNCPTSQSQFPCASCRCFSAVFLPELFSNISRLIAPLAPSVTQIPAFPF